MVRILDVVPDGTGPALAMEYAAGGSLATLLTRRGRLRPEEAVAVAVPLADALGAVHRRGLVHGDVKPANILFTSEGIPVLADFGLAGPATNDDPAHEARTGTVMGTEGYVDPAVVGGAQADERSDVYALGAVCHEMLCGRPPGLDGTGTGETLGPPELAAVVERSIARRPADRFPDMSALGFALRAAAANLPVPPALPPHGAPEVLDGPQRLDDAGPPTRPLGARAHRLPEDHGPAQRPPGHRRARITGAVTASVVAAAGILLGLVTLLAPRLADAPSRPRPQPCPAVTSPLKADVDGDGCPSAVAVRENIVEVDGERYQLGRPGDTLVLGDWDCDGRDTPALYRPSGETFLFDAWAQEGEDLPAASRGEHRKDGHPEVQHGEDGCDRLVVR